LAQFDKRETIAIPYHNNVTTLQAFLSEWTSQEADSTRVAELTDGANLLNDAAAFDERQRAVIEIETGVGQFGDNADETATELRARRPAEQRGRTRVWSYRALPYLTSRR
jgi:hypothetical protein